MKDLLKLIVCWFAFLIAILATGLVNGALHLQPVKMPGNTPAALQLETQLCAGALLVLLFRAPEPRAKATPAIPRAAPTNHRSAAS
jgi:hypothetical protein